MHWWSILKVTLQESEKRNCHIFILNVSWQRIWYSCSDRFEECNACRKHWTTNVSFRWCCKWHLHVGLTAHYSRQLICLSYPFTQHIIQINLSLTNETKASCGQLCRVPCWPCAVLHQGNMRQHDMWPYLTKSVILILSAICGYLCHCREHTVGFKMM